MEAEHLKNLQVLRSKKASEEKGFVIQIERQSEMLFMLKRDKNLQKKVLEEFERNQKTMILLIKKLEQKRKKEAAEAKKRLAEEKKKKSKKVQKEKPKFKKELRGCFRQGYCWAKNNAYAWAYYF